MRRQLRPHFPRSQLRQHRKLLDAFVVIGNPVDDGVTVAGLVEQLGLGGGWVVVERNGEPVDRALMAATVLGEGDVLEIGRAVAGG